MKSFENLNYYEMLELPLTASPFEIREAYKDALSIYNENSLTTYSLFTDDERDTILGKIEEAFLTLIDEDKRADYDRTLHRPGNSEKPFPERRDQRYPTPLFRAKEFTSTEAMRQRVRQKIEGKDGEKISKDLLVKESISGADLKALREAMGVELEEVFEITRVSLSTLAAIENNESEKLPPVIYLKNFLRQYADLLQLDSKKIIDAYLKQTTPPQESDHVPLDPIK